MFAEWHLTRMEESMRPVCATFEAQLVEFNGEAGHGHPLVNSRRRFALSKLDNSLRGSSRWLRQDPPTPSALLEGAAAAVRLRGSVGGAPPSIVRQYIEQQNPPDRARSPAARAPARAFTTALEGDALARI